MALYQKKRLKWLETYSSNTGKARLAKKRWEELQEVAAY
jgi:hypothetical protein